MVNHSDITENEIIEVFSNIYVKAEIEKNIIKIVGHTTTKRFLVIVGVFNKKNTKIKVITAYPAGRKYIILWNKEVNKND